MLVIIMGVSGCGKTTLGNYFAKKYGWRLIDADNFHPKANITKMSEGVPLNDADRLPWLQALHKVIKSWQYKGAPGVLCCSALKESYRDILINGETNPEKKNIKETSAHKTLVVYLKGEKEVISRRITSRNGHFMPAMLLDTQYEILEEPDSPYHNTLCLSVDNSVEDNSESIAQTLTKLYGVNILQKPLGSCI